MEIVVLPTKPGKVGLKFDNLLEKLNARIMEKVDECNNLLDKIDLSSEKEKERRSKIQRISLANAALEKDLRRLRIELAKETEFTYLLDITQYGCAITYENGEKCIDFYYPQDVLAKSREYSPTVEDIQNYYTNINNNVQKIIIKYKNEHNEGKSRAGDRELSENDTEVSA